jgi:hypothetical protein
MRRYCEIYFSCVCGQRHSVPMETPVAFLNPPAANVSLAAFYGHPDRIPAGVQLFRTKPFWCSEKQEIVQLPNLDSFFFELTNGGPLLVG